jgi:hypothetical protein
LGLAKGLQILKFLCFTVVFVNKKKKMSSKLSFRARALDPSKPMPIYFAEELHDLSDYAAINRAVPQMPSGMEKEEESVSGFTNIFLGCFLLHFV